MNSEQTKRLQRLLKAHKVKTSDHDTLDLDPVMQLVLAFFQWEATSKQAQEALGRLFADLVDINELRVTPTDQLLAIIGPGYPHGEQRLVRLRQALREVFFREHALSLASLASDNKKDQRAYLETLPGMMPYAVARVSLVSFSIHSMPVDQRLIRLLVSEQILDAQEAADEAAVEGMLLRQVKADDALATHLSLRQATDALRERTQGGVKKKAASGTAAKATGKTVAAAKVKKKK